MRPYHPTTFLERGVAVPFTTPMLAGTRARPAEKQGLELVIPNPSGGRGVYIMAWDRHIVTVLPDRARQAAQRADRIPQQRDAQRYPARWPGDCRRRAGRRGC